MSQSETPAPSIPRSVLVALFSVYLIWSSTYYAVRVVVREVGPFLLGGGRFLIAGAVFLLLARLRGMPWPTFVQWRNTALVGALLFAIGNGFVAFASQELGSGLIAIVCATMPLAGALLSPLFGVRPSRREAAGLFVGFVATALLASGGDLSASPLAVILLFLSPLGWALGSLLVRKLDVGPPLLAASTQMISGGAMMLAISRVTGEPIPTAIAPSTWLFIAHLVLFGSLVGFFAYQYLLVHARPALAMSYAYVNPVLAVLLGAWVGGETLSASMLVSLALITLAVVLIVTKPKPVDPKPVASALALSPLTAPAPLSPVTVQPSVRDSQLQR